MRYLNISLLLLSAVATAQQPPALPPSGRWPDDIESLLIQYFSDSLSLDRKDVLVRCNTSECEVTLFFSMSTNSVMEAVAGLMGKRFNVWQGGTGCHLAGSNLRICHVTLSNMLYRE